MPEPSPASGAAAAATPRSALFVPADDARKVARATASPADAIILDLEDGVAQARKQAARAAARERLAEADARRLLVRVNDPLSANGAQDLRALAGHAGRIVVPKCDLARLAALNDAPVEVVALVESAAGLKQCGAIAAHERVVGLQLGAEDLAADLGLRPRADGQHLLHARASLVLESAVNGLMAPIDAITTVWEDPCAVAADAQLGRSLGFGGKACIHPAQIAPVNDAFTPTVQELAWARTVVEAHRAGVAGGRGAMAADGQMIDAAVLRRAHRTLRTQHGHEERSA